MTTTRIAIVEDNATARLHLRSHLIVDPSFDIASYSNGKELRNGLRTKTFDLVLIDFHLGQHKNGAEWISHLLQRGLLPPSTAIIFITSDRLPQTIGQILELHPEMIILKPYTIAHLRNAINHCLAVQKQLWPALKLMDTQQLPQALAKVNDIYRSDLPKRMLTDAIKLKGRLLISTKDYAGAIELYSSVLTLSQSVLWAHWGLVRSEFLNGDWQHCQHMLQQLIEAELTKDKAYEWLACVAIGQEQYGEAEEYLDHIFESELTLQATKLKVLCYKMQDKGDEALRLLEKKRQSNFTVKERFDEFTIELARYHIQQAEHEDGAERESTLFAAKCLIGNAKRSSTDRQGSQERDYMMALANVLEGDTQRAERLMDIHELDETQLAKLSTMTDAVKIWFGLGHPERAKKILLECDEQLKQQHDQMERIVADDLIYKTEKQLGLTKEKAIRVNEHGMEHYKKGQFNDALDCFHQAHKMYPEVPAFSLNLLQCLCDAKKPQFKSATTQNLLQSLSAISLTKTNQTRLSGVRAKLRNLA